MNAITDFSNEAGCPSGLAPASAPAGADVTAFVSESGGAKALSLTVRGAKCAGCLSKIESAVGKLPGVREARLNLSNGRMDVRWTGELSGNAVAGTVAGLGYGVAAFDPDKGDLAEKKEERGLLIAMGVAAFAAANVMLLSVSVWAVMARCRNRPAA